MNTDSAIETPDDYTIVFHLKQPFAGFDYLARCPQPSGAEGQGHRRQVQAHVVSTGPYKFDDHTARQELHLVRNTNGTRRPTRTARRCLTVSRSR